MSITSALFTGVNGMKAQSEAMGVISNNISNVNTIGYKDARTLFSDLLSQNIGHNSSQVGLGTQVQKVENQFYGGSLQTTSNISDVALQGDNLFFAVTTDPATAVTNINTSATTKLTRAGAFSVSNTAASAGPPVVAAGNYLVNPDGKFVLDSAGAVINFGTWTPGATPTGGVAGTFGRISAIDGDGTIHAVDTNGLVMTAPAITNAKIGVVRVLVPTELQKSGDSTYSATAAAGVPASYANATALAPTEKIVANSLESSNVDMASEMVNMIVTQRAYSANSKTISVNDQLTNDAIQMVR
jgi:flagellar hook protein FlgE